MYLYSHWRGYEMPILVRDALARQQRWSDGQYLTRIVFDGIKGDDTESETGFGIGAQIGDNGWPVIVLDPKHQMVRIAEEGNERLGPYLREVTFTGFIEMDDDEVRRFCGRME